jgi:hypothetical protein
MRSICICREKRGRRPRHPHPETSQGRVREIAVEQPEFVCALGRRCIPHASRDRRLSLQATRNAQLIRNLQVQHRPVLPKSASWEPETVRRKPKQVNAMIALPDIKCQASNGHVENNRTGAAQVGSRQPFRTRINRSLLAIISGLPTTRKLAGQSLRP